MRCEDLAARIEQLRPGAETRDVARLKQAGAASRRHQCPLCNGSGTIDTGPNLAVMVETVSDIKRSLDRFTP